MDERKWEERKGRGRGVLLYLLSKYCSFKPNYLRQTTFFNENIKDIRSLGKNSLCQTKSQPSILPFK